MYTPHSFKESQIDKLHALIRENSFGILTSQNQGSLQATHLPFMVESGNGKHGTLVTHMARANKHWRSLNEDTEALAIFQGPHGYISPAWYANDATVPTWNYAAVHVYGHPRVIHAPARLHNIVMDLVDFHEAQQPHEWRMDIPDKEMETMLKSIVGIEIPISRIEGKMKFNQNLSEEDQRGVVDHLSASNDKRDKEIADIMAANLGCPFHQQKET